MLLRDFPRLDLRSGELQIEEEAGLGLGAVLFAALFMGQGLWARIAEPRLIIPRDGRSLAIVGAGLIAWLAYMLKMGSESTSRLLAAYYPMLIAGLLVLMSLDGTIMRRAFFKWIGCLAMLSALPLVILSPARPLFPVQLVSEVLTRCHVPETIIERYNNVYTVYGARSDVFRDLVVSIPSDERVLGFLQFGNAPQAALWRPFGTRKVLDVTPDESKEEITARGIHFVIVSQKALALRYGITVADLMARWSASLAAEKKSHPDDSERSGNLVFASSLNRHETPTSATAAEPSDMRPRPRPRIIPPCNGYRTGSRFASEGGPGERDDNPGTEHSM